MSRSDGETAKVESGALGASLRRRLFGISEREIDFEVRGFHLGRPDRRAHLETVGASFVRGYNSGLAVRRPNELHARLSAVDLELQGFAYEGAAMALCLRDILRVGGRTRLAEFIEGDGHPHIYMLHIGAGWAVARLPMSLRSVLAGMDPLLRWLLLDGYGFHQGFFDPVASFERQRVPKRLSDAEREVFDQGLGRSLWFVECAEPDRVATCIDSFPEERQADLWCGVGLASSYAGGVSPSEVLELAARSGTHGPTFRQGMVFAATARKRAGNPTAHIEQCLDDVCGLSLDQAESLADSTRPPAGSTTGIEGYQRWRAGIAAEFD